MHWYFWDSTVDGSSQFGPFEQFTTLTRIGNLTGVSETADK